MICVWQDIMIFLPHQGKYTNSKAHLKFVEFAIENCWIINIGLKIC
jgi:hypothetical protein